MSQLIAWGLALPKSDITTSLAVESALGGPRPLIQHCYFPMFNGANADGSWKALPMWHPTQATSLPYYPLKLADELWSRGQLSLMTWATRNLSTRQAMTSAEITGGKYDSYFHTAAKAVAAWKHPLVIALNPEFNWSGSPQYLTGPDFIASWRYIVDLFRKDGATNVAWSWISNQTVKAGGSATTAEDRLAEYFPGTDYVDLVGLDVYNWAGSRNSTWITFDQVMTGEGTSWIGNTYGMLEKLAPNTPKMIGEFGSHTAPGDKSAWLQDAFTKIPAKYGDIVIASYYQITDGASDWSLKEEDGTAAAFRAAIKSGPYVSGGDLTAMPTDMQPLRSFTRTVLAGDPMPQLAELAQARLTLTSQGSSIRQLTQQVADQSGTLLTLNNTVLTLNSQLADRTTTIGSLTQQLGAAQASMAQAQDALSKAMADADTARANLANAKADLANAKAAARALVQLASI